MKTLLILFSLIIFVSCATTNKEHKPTVYTTVDYKRIHKKPKPRVYKPVFNPNYNNVSDNNFISLKK